MPERRRLRRLIPQPLRHGLYDLSPSRRLRWRRVPGLSRIPDCPAAVLTFDDGPDAAATPEILAALSDLSAKATFFVLGERVAEHPDIACEIHALGHELGLHGMTHRRHDRLSQTDARAELAAGLTTIQDAVGVRPRWYRPPFGRASRQLARACAELDLEIAYWTAWGHDWEAVTADHVASTVQRGLAPGTIVLLHDSARYGDRDDARATIDALPAIVRSAGESSLELLTLGRAIDVSPA